MRTIRRGSDHSFSMGFTLIELLVVVAILLILTVLLDSQFSSSHDRRALLSCQSNLQKIYLALNLYANDNHGKFPYQLGAGHSQIPLSMLVPRCTTETSIFICPASDDKPIPESESFAQRPISYAYYMGWATDQAAGKAIASDWQVDSAPKGPGQQIFSSDGKPPGNNHQKHGGNIVLIGGQTVNCGPRTVLDLRYPREVLLLNPKP
jgi:prepilin-type N-terminal cleavage/methylation domain-containing protein